MNKRTRTLDARIKSVFARVPYPGDDHIVSHYCLECLEIKKQFCGHDWRDLLGTVPAMNSGGLNLLAPESFRYFMPVFLFVCLYKLPEGANITETLLMKLMCPAHLEFYPVLEGNAREQDRSVSKIGILPPIDPANAGQAEWSYLKLVGEFTIAQGRAIADALGVMQNNYPGHFDDRWDARVFVARKCLLERHCDRPYKNASI